MCGHLDPITSGRYKYNILHVHYMCADWIAICKTHAAINLQKKATVYIYNHAMFRINQTWRNRITDKLGFD